MQYITYLTARNRPNLDIWTDTHVTGILFNGRQATSVVCRRDGVQKNRCRDNHFLRCSDSPALLMQSGIGPTQAFGTTKSNSYSHWKVWVRTFRIIRLCRFDFWPIGRSHS